MRNNILFDIDHVISNAYWRDGMIGTASWDDYHLAGRQDKPVEDIVNMIDALGNGFNVIAMTARPERYRKQTLDWMLANKVYVNELLMRPDDNFRPAPEIKMELVKARFANPVAEIAAILDDRLDVCSAFAQIGITTMQVFARSK